MDNSTCIHCGKKFSSVSNLKTHIKTAKYCIKLRAQSGKSDEKHDLTCKWCHKVFTRKSYTTRHVEKCTERPHTLELGFSAAKIAELELKIAELIAKSETDTLTIATMEVENKHLLDHIHEIEKGLAHRDGQILVFENAKPQTVNNTTYINPKLAAISTENIKPLTIETVRDNIHKYEYADFLRGIPGVAKFIEDIISETSGDVVERNYVCTDAARNSFHRLIRPKDWSSDGSAQFIHKILDELRDITNGHFTTLAAEEMASVSDELQREYIDAQKSLVKPVFFGITGLSSGEAREKLFKSLRMRVKGIATV